MSKLLSNPQNSLSSLSNLSSHQFLEECPFSLEELRLLERVFHEPGWKVFSRYRALARQMVDSHLKDPRLSEPFALKHAKALGMDEIQNTYEGIEREMGLMLEHMITAKYEVEEGNS